jgi:hypothetical protein
MRKPVSLTTFFLCLLAARLVCAAEPAPSRLFPLLGDKVPEEMKGQLPCPFGVSLNFVQAIEDLKVSNWDLRVNDEYISPNLVKATELKQKTNVESVRFDTWVLPFLNIYGVFGNVEGKVSEVELGLLNKPVPTSFKIPFDGIVYGGGTTIAAGYDIYFVTCDVNYTYSEINIWESAVETLMTTPRAGIRVPIKKVNVSLYGGANNEKIMNRLNGSYTTVEGTRLDIALDASASSPWVALAGTQIEFGKHWGLIIESSFGNRQTGICSMAYRW